MQPYKIILVEHNYFVFSTTAGIKYACYFLSYAELFKQYPSLADNIYSFNIDILDGAKRKAVPLDARAGYTIVEIVRSFLEKMEDVVVYVCDNSDGREALRKRKFDLWFRKYDDGSIIKVDGYMSAPDFDIYNAILVHKDNPKKNRFIEVFIALNSTDPNK